MSTHSCLGLWQISATRPRKLMQWSHPILVLGCHVGAALDEELCDNHISTNRSRQLMYRCRPILVLGCHIGAMLDKDLGEIHISAA